MTTVVAKRKADLKVVILGDRSIGKTTLIHRYIDGKFTDTSSTIGASFSLKQWGSYNVALWDTAGEERFSGLSSFYCRGAKAAILAYDLTNEDTFHALRARFLPLLEAAEKDCLVVVVGTKSDLLMTDVIRPIPKQDAILLATNINNSNLSTVPYYETSSITGQNVDAVFDYILNHCLPLGRSLSKSSSKTGIVDLESTQNAVPQGQERQPCCSLI